MARTQLTAPASASDHSEGGGDNAQVTLVEYGDYQCSYCGQAYPIVKNAQAHMGDKLRFVFRNFPLSQIHAHAVHAAAAAEAAAAQGKFWPMHDMLYENQQSLHDADLVGYARELGLDEKKFAADMTARKIEAKIQADLDSGAESGVNGTPSFFINGVRFDGNYQDGGLLRALQGA